ncbi:T9SS type A sorting domain-containing protein [Flavobacterium haoranii]|uniref:Por secretion system C-terminal sorting domain-containing protein n=1 Tax=Flavobacterium haoranii TaxID=683124 RepID=A0A1M6INE3_9FLAO|nr:T9SS type A sorting domain-containing protein [Flavobacterium haoranii]SHJ35968.1 Por secretion system C-terminal sorting domain-containing protein [Flavobacterium haoranii]
MKTIKNIYLYLLLFPILSLSQSFQWIQNGGGNNTISGSFYYQKEQVIDIATDSQRNVYIISIVSKDGALVNENPITTYEANSNNYDFLLVSYSCDGNYRWHKVFGGGSSEYPSCIEVDSQDNIFIIGFFAECDLPSDLYYSTARIGDNNGIDYTSPNTPTSCQRTFLAKFNSNGTFQWIHFPYSAIDNFPYSSHPFSSRNFYIIDDEIYWIASIPPGSYEGGSFSNTNNSFPFLYYLLKYDTSGNFISATPFDLELSNYTSAELRWYRNPYNGYYYALYLNNSSNNITVSAGGNNLDYTLPKIICFNELGQYQWHRESTGTNFNFLAIDFDSSNNVFISGATKGTTTDSFLGWTLNGLFTGASSYIMKCNPNLTAYNWVTYYTTPGFIAGYIQQPLTSIYYDTFNNELVFGGSIATSTFSWNPVTLTGPGSNNSSDPLLARFDPSNGSCLGMHRIIGTNGYQDAFTSIEQDIAGDLIVGGYMGLDLTDSYGNTSFTSGGNSDFFVTKFANQVCQSLSNESFESDTIEIYPNPTKNILNIINLSENCEYTIFNIMGSKVLYGKVTRESNSIDLSELQSGYYILNLNKSNGLNKTLKVIKE